MKQLIRTKGSHIQFSTIIEDGKILSIELEGIEGNWLPPAPLLKIHAFPIPQREIAALRNNLHQTLLAVCGPPETI